MAISGWELAEMLGAAYGLGLVSAVWFIVADIHRQNRAIYRRYHPRAGGQGGRKPPLKPRQARPGERANDGKN